jgi:hypothetical protein
MDRIVALNVELAKIRRRLVRTFITMSVTVFLLYIYTAIFTAMGAKHPKGNPYFWTLQYLFFILACLLILYDVSNRRRLKERIKQYEKRLNAE